jgi:hypothetical protein
VKKRLVRAPELGVPVFLALLSKIRVRLMFSCNEFCHGSMGVLSELRAEGQSHLAVVKDGWRLEGVVQPCEKVTIDEQLLPQ